MIPLPCFRAAAASLIAGSLLLTGCATAKYKKATVGNDRLATPPHNLSPAEYPFDDDGTYRKDWVANPSKARRTASKHGAPASVPAPPPSQGAYAAYPPPAAAPVPPRPAPAPPPAPKPAPAAKPARYHTVVKGDTLYSISRKYGATVPKLKSTNGLSSDTIRIGQTLRVP